MNHIPDGLQAFWNSTCIPVYIYLLFFKNSSVDVKIEIH